MTSSAHLVGVRWFTKRRYGFGFFERYFFHGWEGREIVIGAHEEIFFFDQAALRQYVLCSKDGSVEVRRMIACTHRRRRMIVDVGIRDAHLLGEKEKSKVLLSLMILCAQHHELSQRLTYIAFFPRAPCI
ncbi:TPA: hypothetical protein DEP34_01645 [Candidatus Uhrbacteria bacterium]|uniref:Uncharacterized protein n=2 Tax=Candidatus Uhriibacteriota TaxID=1752732 RepID=A0A0G1Q736_9BACT|nr:MAG: hypothetical protein UX45_C0012G0057 [Candidatus Uhrbacteria bacterium GW2011_GWF2_46_218]KKU40814.1 MAG: hypothetical protein UX57_C0010G0058 [Candidatus Uhrbacteria bacterium GW2011_GWE2_46_68]HBK34213.1 hypothetical protein [Candidatus Uhrbacteria bacterium]HCB19072.1 hypothetical protein [Candidatus Uhrbacteria bacterium]